ncbi:saccharopine dehydrogenase family protein [Alkalilimnicola sp. S0819]|uniref:saccharopine dehydrogenase family protein n=1 Tax=Alkalilimnicola sp. S0819 TaxID=2613922 RepID=UPI001261A90C|nr:saccharopine dehydrogenase NADP-binding domain-containing protein [Alkalilimnicola sp. S0819]KAB7619655.1 hypothetical protein F3N43_13210 [Alkalilimnicola sp. S0819]MPQ17593.1 hypothetical protein [Alkalilimnicola sp. S0819]
MENARWMIYGAYGYTGRLIVAEAHRRGLNPVIAGRDRERLRLLAREYGCEQRAFEIDHARGVKAHLKGMELVLLCAGPFSATASHVIKACLAREAHYLDITGEIPVFQDAHAHHRLARQAGVVLCPGVGFDVVPTDCLALTLKHALPEADRLALGFESASPLAPGTAKSLVEMLAQGGRRCRDSEIRAAPLARRARDIDFGNGTRHAVSLPWADLFSAHHSTGIPDIEVFLPLQRRQAWRLKMLAALRPMLGLRPLQQGLQRMIARRVHGPSPAERAASPSFVWGEARAADGQRKTARIRTANVYDLSAYVAVDIAAHVLCKAAPAGFTTPGLLMGADYITRLPGSGVLELIRN